MPRKTGVEWQDQLDRDFPDGAVCLWTDNLVMFSTARFLVEGMANGRPRLLFYDAANNGKLWHEVLLRYEPLELVPGLPEDTVARTLHFISPSPALRAMTPQLTALREEHRRLLEVTSL